MISLFHFIHLAFHNLLRGGRRVFVTLLCIIFGVTVLVSMTMIARSVESTILVEPALLLGGDLSIGRIAEDSIRPQDVQQLESLQQSGEISVYTLIAFNSSSITFHTGRSGALHFVANGLGIEPEKYPLAGALGIGEPQGAVLQDLLKRSGDVIVTRDLALEYDLKVGDAIVLSDLRSGIPVQGTVRGIAVDTPNHQGDKVYYTIPTAETMAGGNPVLNTAIVNAPDAGKATAALEATGWMVDSAASRNGNAGNLWTFGLRGAGILGLLVSGVGIADTMQVLIRRRQREIAIWKTLGYRGSQLRFLFTLEASLLGLAGSIIGAGLGSLISGQVLELIRRTSSVLYHWTFSFTPPLMGILVGFLSTLIFAYWAVLVSGQARPMALLRNEPVRVQGTTGCLSAGLGLLLAIPFTAVLSLVMHSFLEGLGVLVALLAGIAVLGGFFRLLLWGSTRLLRLRRVSLAHLAFRSLQRRSAPLVFAMIALFAGVISMSLGLEVVQLSALKTSGVPTVVPGYNLNILASASQESAVQKALETLHPEKVGRGYRAALASLETEEGQPVEAMDPVLVGRSDPQDYVLSGASWGSRPDGVYVYQGAGLEAGSQVSVTFSDGVSRLLPVVGTYDINYGTIALYPPTGLLMSVEGFEKIARPDSILYFIQVAPRRLGGAVAALGASLPQATVVNLVDYAGRFMEMYRKIVTLPLLMAGLALLAGCLLIANSVSLAMLDRRYEVGILKSIGYSRRHLLGMFAVEYGLVGVLATVTGVAAIQLFFTALALLAKAPPRFFLLGLPSLAVVAIAGVGATVLTVLTVAWKPTRLPPIAALSEHA